MNDATVLGRSQRWDRAILLSGLAALAALLWTATTLLVSGTHAGHADVAPLVAMWVLMMAAMMVPVAAPCLLSVAVGDRESRDRRDRLARASLFLSGDLLVWTAFSLLAACAQWWLREAALLSPTMAISSSVFSGALLVAIGLFQFTPMKEICLRRCRALPGSAADGVRDRQHRSVFRLGLEHGAFSAGSCGALMLVLFATGVMSLPAMAVLTAILVLERVVPGGLWVSHTLGALLAAWGSGILLSTLA